MGRNGFVCSSCVRMQGGWMSGDESSRRKWRRGRRSKREYEGNLSRRGFLSGVGAVTGAAALGFPAAEAQTPPKATAGAVPLRIKVNGQQHQLSLDPRVT